MSIIKRRTLSEYGGYYSYGGRRRETYTEWAIRKIGRVARKGGFLMPIIRLPLVIVTDIAVGLGRSLNRLKRP